MVIKHFELYVARRLSGGCQIVAPMTWQWG